MGKSKIEWTDATWNPVTGCTEISSGCKNCYAKGMAKRLKAMGQHKYRNEFKVTTHPESLDEPLKWKKPRRIFVCSMSDLFHEFVPFFFIKDIWNIASKARQHTFTILTKRPERMLAFTKWMAAADHISAAHWPRNVYLGVTAENQERFDERWQYLKNIPAAVKLISYEPGLGSLVLPADFLELGKRAWVICGGESGPGARPLHPDWVRSLRDQCKAARVPFFFKQHGEWREARREELEHEAAFGTKQSGWISLAGDYADQGREEEPDPVWDREGATLVVRVGKKKAGRELDGVIHSAMPETK